MARAFPNSTFVGYDSHNASIVAARKTAAEAGLVDRVSFEVANAKDIPDQQYDLVTFVDGCTTWETPSGRCAESARPSRPTAP